MKPPRRLTLPLRLALGVSRAAPALPRFLAARAHAVMGAEPARLAERLGRPSLPRPTGRLVWVHAASVGEVAAVRDLAVDLAREAGAALLLTTATQGGAQTAPSGALHQFAPLDTPGAVRGFLDHWRPDLGLFVEGDLWPRLVLLAAGRGVPLALLNARASRTRARLPRSTAALLSRFRLATAQDEDVAAELRALGVPRAEAVGDLRAAATPPAADPVALAALQAQVVGRPVWAAVSTHPGDEAAVVRAAHAARGALPGLLLLWAPRHPSRAEPILAALSEAGLSAVRRSAGEAADHDTDVLLLDTLGETGLVFRTAPLVFLGGSFGPEGGHNPWEPVSLGCALLSGPHVAHHRDGFRRLTEAGAAVLLDDPGTLGPAVAGLLFSPELVAMQAAARAIAAQGSHARARTLELLRPLLVAPG